MGGIRKWLRLSALGLAAVTASTSLVSPAHAAAPKDQLVYVALGDSYTSGPIVLPHDTTFVPEDCGQSIYNYPHLAAKAIKADVFRDVSCGGATIDDFTEPQEGITPPRSTNPPEFNALDRSVDVVTLGMGGNDVGFVGLALDCIRVSPQGQPCTPSNFKNGVDLVSKKIKATGLEMDEAIEQIHVKAPHAAVLVVGYPTALPDDAKACWPYLPILQADMPYLVAKFKEMNAMLKTSAKAHHATYVDIYTPSIGHDACKPPGIAWVNGAVLVPPSFPAHPNYMSFKNGSGPVVTRAIEAALRYVKTHHG